MCSAVHAFRDMCQRHLRDSSITFNQNAIAILEVGSCRRCNILLIVSVDGTILMFHNSNGRHDASNGMTIPTAAKTIQIFCDNNIILPNNCDNNIIFPNNCDNNIILSMVAVCPDNHLLWHSAYPLIKVTAIILNPE